MTLLKRKRLVAAKVESTPGTDATLANGDASFNAYNIIAQATIPVEERESQNAFGRLSGVSGPRMGKISFRTDLGWDGTVTMPTWASVLLPLCGVVESSQVYTPRSEDVGTNVKTGTIGVYQAGRLKKILGAVGNCKMVFPTGRMAYADWEFTGVWQDVTDTAALTPTYPTASPIKYSSATTTYNSVAKKNEQVTLDFGNVIKLIEDESTAAGYAHALVVDRNPKLTINPLSTLVATHDTYGAWLASTESAFSLALDGPTDSTITLAAPKAQIINNQEGEREGVETEDIELQCNKNGATADEEFSLTFAESS